MKLNKKAGIGPIFCWFSGLLTLAVCLSIIVFLLVKGVPSLSWRFLTTHPEVSLTEGLGGGILGPLAGTLLLTVMGILVALPWAWPWPFIWPSTPGKTGGPMLCG